MHRIGMARELKGSGRVAGSWRRAVAWGLVLALSAVASSGAGAQDSRSRVPTVTRLVKVVVDLEEQLADATLAGDVAKAETLVADDFEMRIGALPGTPIPRAEWLRESIARKEAVQTIEQVAVHDLGDVLIASYLRPGMAGNRRDPGRNAWFVDVWQRFGEAWKLRIRYGGPSGTKDFPLPAGGALQPAAPKRY